MIPVNTEGPLQPLNIDTFDALTCSSTINTTMGTSEEDRVANNRSHSRMDPDPELDPQHAPPQQHFPWATMPRQQTPEYASNPTPIRVGSTSPTSKFVAGAMIALDAEPIQEISQASPISPQLQGQNQNPGPMPMPQQQPMLRAWEQRAYNGIHLPNGPVATPITRFLTKQTLGYIPKTAAPTTAYCLPRIHVPSSPSFPLPSLAQCLDEVGHPKRYQRSLSCPSDAMARGLPHLPSVAASPNTNVQLPPAAVLIQPSDARMSRLERSSSMDSHGGMLAMPDAVPYTSPYRPECSMPPQCIDLHQWLSLESLANSANMQNKMTAAMSSPRGVGIGADLLHYDSSGAHSSASEPRREKKLCAFPQCTSNAVTRGLCISHGGGRRCQRKGCTRGAQSKGLCVAHGGGRICKARGCSNIQRSMGLCIRHGGGKRCSVPGCQKGVVRQDLCTAHGGKRKCRVDGCNKHVKKKGLCRAHANAAALSSPLRGLDLENLHVSVPMSDAT